MKKIFMGIFAMILLAITHSQTIIRTNFPEAGYIEQYHGVYSSDYRAVANPGYEFMYWTAIATYRQYYDTVQEIFVDSVHSKIITQWDTYMIDGKILDRDGWLLIDGGVPNLNKTPNPEIKSIVLIAWFKPQNKTANWGQGNSLIEHYAQRVGKSSIDELVYYQLLSHLTYRPSLIISR